MMEFTEIRNKINLAKGNKPKPALDNVLKTDSSPHRLGVGGCSTSVFQDTMVGPATAMHRLSSFGKQNFATLSHRKKII